VDTEGGGGGGVGVARHELAACNFDIACVKEDGLVGMTPSCMRPGEEPQVVVMKLVLELLVLRRYMVVHRVF
jgi:hypothetical protein